MTRPSWLIAGVGLAAAALVGPLPSLAHHSFTAHMAQHLLLVLIAAPLLLAGAPVTALLQATRGRPRKGVARLLRSRAAKFLTHPLMTWGFFAVVMWVTHFSPLYQAALDNELVHFVEHGLYISAGLLFWSPVIASDPISRRALAHPARLGYLVAALPLQSFLGLALYSSATPLYPAYPDLADQRAGALVMWLGGDFVFVIAIALAIGAWMRADRTDAARKASRA
ncbi:MAG: cytochrome c oxidase assembly protein [Actinomycetota bacterium]|nr:cytochrome c oxidase assembly protein [Actinomycetota bacterium]